MDLNALLRESATNRFDLLIGRLTAPHRQIRHNARYGYAVAARQRPATRRSHGASSEPSAIRQKKGSHRGGIRDTAASRASSLEGSNRSRYARLSGSEPGIDPYTRAVSDVYQDLFGEGSFVGKGIYDVDAFERGAQGAFPRKQNPQSRSGRLPCAIGPPERRAVVRELPVHLPGRRGSPASLDSRRLAAFPVAPARRRRPGGPEAEKSDLRPVEVEIAR